MSKNFNRQYKDDAGEPDLDKIYPDPPFTQSTYDAMKIEVDAIDKEIPKQAQTLREAWIVKNGGGVWGDADGFYGIAVKSTEYIRLAKKWEQFTTWEAKKDYAKKKEIEDLAKAHESEINNNF